MTEESHHPYRIVSDEPNKHSLHAETRRADKKKRLEFTLHKYYKLFLDIYNILN